MRCPGCSADVSALREFCPICGTPMDAGIRESLQGARNERPTKSRKGVGKVAVIGAILLSLGVATQVEWPWDGPTINVERDEVVWAPGPVTIEAEELHQAYADNPGAAAGRFGGREMVVSGEFLRIVPDGYGSLDLRLKTSDPNAQLGVDVAELAIEDAKRLRPGQRVTVSCQGMGDGGDELWVRDCAIQLGGDAAPTPPPPPEAPEPAEDAE
ncbi:MAG: hypothetical protein ACO1OD_07420 [Croceibacterium sp.]